MRAQEVLERHRGELLRLPGVVGVGIGRSNGETIELLVESQEGRNWPRELEGVPVRVRVVGRPKASDEGLDGTGGN